MCGVVKGRYVRLCSGERGDLGVRMCRVLAVGFVVGCSSWYVRCSSLYDTELNYTQLSLSVIGVFTTCVIRVLKVRNALFM